MDYLQKIVIDFEIQSVQGIKECFENGVSPNDTVNGEPLIKAVLAYDSGVSIQRDECRVGDYAIVK